jgi:hypothetical protein
MYGTCTMHVCGGASHVSQQELGRIADAPCNCSRRLQEYLREANGYLVIIIKIDRCREALLTKQSCLVADNIEMKSEAYPIGEPCMRILHAGTGKLGAMDTHDDNRACGGCGIPYLTSYEVNCMSRR